MIARRFPMLLATLLIACAGESADTATRADTAADTSTSNVTAEDCMAEQVFVTACTGCGPTDGCTGYAPMCVEACSTVEEEPLCIDGVCQDGVCLPMVCG